MNINPNNSLVNLLNQYIQPQPQQQYESNDQPQEKQPVIINNNISAIEINSKSEMEYTPPDKTGRTQIFYCPNEKRIYTSRYNFVTKNPDYKSFLDEGEVELFKNANSNNEDIAKVAIALTAVADQLKIMQSEIQELKARKPRTTKPKAETVIEESVAKISNRGNKK